MSLQEPTVEVLEFLSDIRFHRSYVLPANPATGRTKPHRFTFSDFGDPNSNAVVFFCGGLMGTRLSYSHLDQSAKTLKVRIIQVDRPGMGGTDPIELEKRVQIWLEMVPPLLEYLNVPYVSLASHSGGSIFLLNTLLAYPHLLHPHKPYVCLFAPWVRPSHSKVTLWQITSQLPAPVIGKFATLARVVNDNVMPLMASSGFKTRDGPVTLTGSLTPASLVVSDGDYHGLALNDANVLKELRNYIGMFVFAESIEGASADCQLFLNKPRAVPWCSPSMAWSDIDDFVPIISKIFEEDTRLDSHNRTLTIDAFHAESDHMVGTKGSQWFDNCWITGRPATSSPREPVQQYNHQNYDYRSEVVKGSDHDFLIDPAFGASELWLQRVRGSIPTAVEV